MEEEAMCRRRLKKINRRKMRLSTRKKRVWTKSWRNSNSFTWVLLSSTYGRRKGERFTTPLFLFYRVFALAWTNRDDFHWHNFAWWSVHRFSALPSGSQELRNTCANACACITLSVSPMLTDALGFHDIFNKGTKECQVFICLHQGCRILPRGLENSPSESQQVPQPFQTGTLG